MISLEHWDNGVKTLMIWDPQQIELLDLLGDNLISTGNDKMEKVTVQMIRKYLLG